MRTSSIGTKLCFKVLRVRGGKGHRDWQDSKIIKQAFPDLC